MFDLVTAVESHYFWPDLVSDMKELFRVLKPGGMLVMMGGEYKGGRYDERNEQWVELARLARAVTRARNFPNLAATKKLG
jgi:SAM-dependent methyltransferase